MPDEKDMIEGLKSGNHETWRNFIDEFKDRIYKTALSYIPFAEEAEDLAQEVFVEVYQNIHKFRQEASLSTWVYRITVNRAINYLKKNRKYHTTKPIEEYFILETEPALSGQDASTSLQEKESRRIIHQAISDLPERQATVFVMHKIEGKSYKEIAEILDITVPSVESLMHRAKITLQGKLQSLYRQYHK